MNVRDGAGAMAARMQNNLLQAHWGSGLLIGDCRLANGFVSRVDLLLASENAE